MTSLGLSLTITTILLDKGILIIPTVNTPPMDPPPHRFIIDWGPFDKHHPLAAWTVSHWLAS